MKKLPHLALLGKNSPNKFAFIPCKWPTTLQTIPIENNSEEKIKNFEKWHRICTKTQNTRTKSQLNPKLTNYREFSQQMAKI